MPHRTARTKNTHFYQQIRTALAVSLATILTTAPGHLVSDSSTPKTKQPKQTTQTELTRQPSYPKIPKTLLLDITARDNTLLAVGQRGHILRSSDGGQQFSPQNTPTRHTLTSVEFISPHVAISAGHHLTILRSEDAGKTWLAVPVPREDSSPWLDVLALPDQRVIAVGAYGHVGHSEDQGQTWTVDFATDEDFHLNAITQTGPQQLVIASEAGRVYVSNDLGGSWQGFDSPYEGSFFAIQKIANNQALLLGLRGTILLADFSQATPDWTFPDTPSEQSWFGVSQPSPSGDFWLVGAAGQLAYWPGANSISATGSPKAMTRALPIQFLNRPDRATLAHVLNHQAHIWTVGENGLSKYEAVPVKGSQNTTQQLTETEYAFQANQTEP